MLLTDILKTNAQKFADKKALTMLMGFRTVSLTYKDVYDLALKTACLLEQNNVQKDDKVLILAPNSPYWIIVWWGCLLRGAILVPLNMQSTTEIIKKIAGQTEAKIIFKPLHFRQEVPAGLRVFNIEYLIEDLAKNLEGCLPAIVTENDLAEIMYTSGTTGEPKGVMLTHKNLYSNLEAVFGLIPSSKFSSADRFLSILPLSHIFEQLAGFFLPFKAGAEIIYAHSPAAIVDLIKEHRVTKMAGVPEFLRVVMSKIEKIGFQKAKFFNRLNLGPFASLDTVISGGAPLEADLEKKWLQLGVNLLQGYGLTETSPVISTNTFNYHCFGSVGKVVPGVEVKIVDGEILIRGPNVFQGYYKNEEKTRAAFTDDGWFKTDDMGEMNKDGYLYVKGRKKYIIKGAGAQNIFPEDIEFELNKIPGVKDSCVVGRTKLSGLLEIHAVILPPDPRSMSNIDQIVVEANKHLASYQQISGWSVWPDDDFPRSVTRKVKKEEILKWLKSRAERIEIEPRVHTAPLERLVAQLVDVNASQVKHETNLVRDLGLDSLMRIELVASIEEEMGVEINEAAITPTTTIADLEKLIKAAKPLPKIKFKKWPISGLARLLRDLVQALFVFPLTRIFVKLKVEGRENLENLPLPVIFMPNHISYLDSLVILLALPKKIRRKIAYAAAVDVLYEQYKNWAWLAGLIFNSFPFPRQENENVRFGLEYMGRLLDRGYSIVVYPEGRLSETGELQLLKRGAGLIGVEMGCSVVPTRITGTNQIVPYGKIFPRKTGSVAIKFGRPIKFNLRDSYISSTEEIQKLLGNL